jgi:hypothetical protein
MRKKSPFLQTPIKPFAAFAIVARRKAPVLTLASRVMTIDGQTVSHDRFEEVNESAV